MLERQCIDTNFYSINGPFLLKEVLEHTSCNKRDSKNIKDLLITSVSKIECATKNDIVFILANKEFAQLENTKSQVCIINENDIHKIKSPPKDLQIFTSNNAYYSYTKAISLFYTPKKFTTLKQWENLNNNQLGKNTVIHHSVTIGTGTTVGDNSIIGHGVKIGKNCIIRENVSIFYAIIGDNVTLDPGCVIGQEGLGFVAYQGKKYTVSHIGRVIIEDNVRIFCNTVVDKGFYEDTVIGENTLIDSLVKIAHNVRIGKNCVILSQVGIAGGTVIGNNCLIAGQAGLIDYVKVGNNVSIAARSVVTKDIPAGIAVAGFPAIPINEWRKQVVYKKKLNKLF